MSGAVILFATLAENGEPVEYSDEPVAGLHGRLMVLSEGTTLLRPQGEALRFSASTGGEYDIAGALKAGLIADESASRQHVLDLMNQIAAHNAIWQHLIWDIVLGAQEDLERYELAETNEEIVLYRDKTPIGAVRQKRWWAPLERHHMRDLAAILGAKIVWV